MAPPQLDANLSKLLVGKGNNATATTVDMYTYIYSISEDTCDCLVRASFALIVFFFSSFFLFPSTFFLLHIHTDPSSISLLFFFSFFPVQYVDIPFRCRRVCSLVRLFPLCWWLSMKRRHIFPVFHSRLLAPRHAYSPYHFVVIVRWFLPLPFIFPHAFFLLYQTATVQPPMLRRIVYSCMLSYPLTPRMTLFFSFDI